MITAKCPLTFTMASLATKKTCRLGRGRIIRPSDMEVTINSRVFCCAVTLSLMCGAVGGIDVLYMTPLCNSSIQASAGGLIEADRGLYYRENLDCYLTVVGLPTHRLLLQFARFALESDSNGNCYDSLDVFDGNAVGVSPLTPELCGRLHELPDVESSESNVTLRLRTDDSGRMMGFGIYYTQFTEAPCSSDQFQCNNSRCIDPTLTCNTLNMCGDWSDEGNCFVTETESGGFSTVAAVGIMVAILIVGYTLIIIITKLMQVYREKQLMKQMVAQVDRDIRNNPFAYSSTSLVDQQDVDASRAPSGGSMASRKRTSKVIPS